jgi:hypothetical protein
MIEDNDISKVVVQYVLVKLAKISISLFILPSSIHFKFLIEILINEIDQSKVTNNLYFVLMTLLIIVCTILLNMFVFTYFQADCILYDRVV